MIHQYAKAEGEVNLEQFIEEEKKASSVLLGISVGLYYGDRA